MAIIDKPTDYFNTKLYTGTGSELAITGVGFQPDWTWIKGRNVAYDHNLFDAVRGATKTMKSNKSDAESTQAQMLKSFDSDGFTIGTDGALNENDTRTYVAWNWKAGTSFTNDASSTGIGSIDSSGSFNNDSGFSIVSYTGGGSNATVKHGLNTAPSMIIFKRRVGSGWNWSTYHKSMGNNYFVSLNLTNAKSNTSSSTHFQDTTPTSSVFSIGDSGHLNGDDIIAYCFADKQGYSKFGGFVGNGNNDGTFVYTGFKPALLIAKSHTSTNDWVIFDNKRDPFNLTQHKLYPSANDAAATSENDFDFLSNGFKLRQSGYGTNTFIYMAFAENPFVTSTGVPATAR